MDLEVPLAATRPTRQQNPATILCYSCGAAIDGTNAAGALCQDCVKLTVDVSEGIQRESTLHTCRDCDRWLSPPNQWLMAAPESRELLALCLRKLRGLSKARIIDASFIWTEPHSRRIKVKITIQQEAFQGTILQQTFEAEFVVATHQCPDCAKSYTHNTWRANVQVRQKVPHKRTFLYLEQLILKNGAHKDTINIKEVDNGIDFYFAQRNQAEKFVDFITSVAPVRSKKSQQLISMDVHTSTKSYKFTYSIEIVPVCKDDLVVLPIKVAKQIGNVAPLTLCYRVGTTVNLLDPNTLQMADISAAMYWRSPFPPLTDVQNLTEFVVMDIEPLQKVKGRFILAEATVRRSADLGVNDTEYTTRTHLGGILHPGDLVMGYHLTGTNFNSEFLDAIQDSKTYSSMIPDVVLVKKAYTRRRKPKSRNWRLKRMALEEEEALPSKRDPSRSDLDFENFLRDIEEDEELRDTMDLYRAQNKQKAPIDYVDGMDGVDQHGDEDDESGRASDDGLDIPLEQLREELEDMHMDG